jgi:hypothetical protein
MRADIEVLREAACLSRNFAPDSSMPFLPLDHPEPFSATIGVMLYPAIEEATKARAFAAQFLAEPIPRLREAGHRLSYERRASPQPAKPNKKHPYLQGSLGSVRLRLSAVHILCRAVRILSPAVRISVRILGAHRKPLVPSGEVER